jgi:hypothetical protein
MYKDIEKILNNIQLKGYDKIRQDCINIIKQEQRKYARKHGRIFNPNEYFDFYNEIQVNMDKLIAPDYFERFDMGTAKGTKVNIEVLKQWCRKHNIEEGIAYGAMKKILAYGSERWRLNSPYNVVEKLIQKENNNTIDLKIK